MQICRKKIIRRECSDDFNIAFPELHPLLRRIYVSRQVKSLTEVDIALERLLPYQSLLDIDKAIQLLTEAITKNQKY